MSDAPRYPDIDGKSTERQVLELRDYIINLHRYIRYALNNIDARNMTAATASAVRKIDGLESATQTLSSSVEQNADSIIHTVERVTQVEADLEGIETVRFYTRYSAYSDGRDMTEGPTETTEYMGTCSINSSTAPTDPSAYTWVRIVGSDGDDASVLRVESSRGTVFKNNAVSSILRAVVYKGKNRITNMTDLRSAYGIATHIEWKWQRMGEDDFHPILATDSKIGEDGFTLTLTPDDIDTKTNFRCRLIME